jgi:hypothetical protein
MRVRKQSRMVLGVIWANCVADFRRYFSKSCVLWQASQQSENAHRVAGLCLVFQLVVMTEQTNVYIYKRRRLDDYQCSIQVSMAHSPRLFPAFPNEIGDAIILHLPFADLMSGYFVSKSWRTFIDKNDKISEKLFRYPENVRCANAQAREDFVDNVWQNVYNRIGNDRDISDIWDHIKFNLLFDHPDAERSIHEEGYSEVFPQEAFNLALLPQVPAHSQERPDKLWRSMFVTYPPINRIHIQRYSRGSTVSGFSLEPKKLLNPRGIKLGTLEASTRENRFHNVATGMGALWLGRAY